MFYRTIHDPNTNTLHVFSDDPDFDRGNENALVIQGPSRERNIPGGTLSTSLTDRDGTLHITFY